MMDQKSSVLHNSESDTTSADEMLLEDLNRGVELLPGRGVQDDDTTEGGAGKRKRFWGTALMPHNARHGKRIRFEPSSRAALFDQWLCKKAQGIEDHEIGDLLQDLEPEDIYQHFKEYIPDNQTFTNRVQYERQCAEEALYKCDCKSWLLRRSSFNRRQALIRLSGTTTIYEVQAVDGIGEKASKAHKAASPHQPWPWKRPTFYAFSYRESGAQVNHYLIFKYKNLWFQCTSDATGAITPRVGFDSLISLIEQLLEIYNIRADRMLHGYYTPISLA